MIQQRIIQFIDYKDISKYKFYKKTGLSNGFLDKKGTIGADKCEIIYSYFPEINLEWLLTGEGEMLKKNKDTFGSKNLIPLYEDVSTIGGNNIIAETEAVYNTSIQIDAGDWFKGATAAIRHYGDSMIEYPSGSILAIRELKNKNEIVWGRNYVVETSEMRITKQIAELDKFNIICYSSNIEKHPDGRLKHQPIEVKKTDVRHISRVLGSVNKEESTGKVQLL